MDLSKTFYLVDYSILKDKLYEYELRGHFNSWLKSYFTNKKQFVDYQSIFSKKTAVNIEVPPWTFTISYICHRSSK